MSATRLRNDACRILLDSPRHPMQCLSTYQWALLALGALLTGLSKTGIAGLGILSVVLFANALPARESTGALLPLLVVADMFGVALYRKHGDWQKIMLLLPWSIVGILVGYLAMGRIDEPHVRRLLGCIAVAMLGLHLWRQRCMAKDPDGWVQQLPHSPVAGCLIGILAGFTTMMANAAGPVMVLYLLAMGLPKLVFLGTMAWLFLVLNLIKLPFSCGLGLITTQSLLLDAILLAALIPGVLLGPVVVKRLNQRTFERVVLFFTMIAAIRLLL